MPLFRPLFRPLLSLVQSTAAFRYSYHLSPEVRATPSSPSQTWDASFSSRRHYIPDDWSKRKWIEREQFQLIIIVKKGQPSDHYQAAEPWTIYKWCATCWMAKATVIDHGRGVVYVRTFWGAYAVCIEDGIENPCSRPQRGEISGRLKPGSKHVT
jgi:hypothetical protein